MYRHAQGSFWTRWARDKVRNILLAQDVNQLDNVGQQRFQKPCDSFDKIEYAAADKKDGERS